MIVDIHTHHTSSSEFPAIRNIEFSDPTVVLPIDESSLFSIGIHPWFVEEISSNSFENLMKWANDKRVVAMGECGLDKNSKTSVEQQLHIFEKQIHLSEIVGKPLIIHCVGCYNELFALKKRINPSQQWIIHGFRSHPSLARQALKAGFSLSFGEHFNPESVQITPIEKLFIETDESKISIAEIYFQIAKYKSCHSDELIAGFKLINKHLVK